MRLKLTNINKINRADITLNGLTVIAGINDSGKSTIGKVLFSIIKALNAKNQKSDLVRNSLYQRGRNFYRIINKFEREENVKILGSILPQTSFDFISLLNHQELEYDYLVREFDNLEIKPQYKAIIKTSLKKIFKLVYNRSNALDFLTTELQIIIEAEFLNSICTYDTDSSRIEFSENEQTENLDITIQKNKITSISANIKENTIIDDVTLVESPLYLHLIDILSRADTLNERIGESRSLIRPLVNYHIKDMARKLDAFRYISNIPSLFDIENENIFDDITGGHFILDPESQNIYWGNEDKKYPVVNVASGIKSFGVMQMLMEVQAINERKMLIWDEPENHLHPEWQIKLAEFLVKLANNGIPILLTSHSPYFIQAIKYYSNKLKMNSFVNFYMADEFEGDCIINDYTNDLNKIFYKLAQPMNEIINLDL